MGVDRPDRTHKFRPYYQGTMRCTPTDVPLWEIPILNPIAHGYLWVSYPQESPTRTPAKYHGSTLLGVHPIVP